MPGDARRGALLDRDGVLNVRPAPHAYLGGPEEFEWLPGAREAVARLEASGWVVAVVTNQRGLSLGRVSPEAIAAIEERIQSDLAVLGAAIDGFYTCPHDTPDGCDCRKPQPGLLLRACEELGLDPAGCVMVGDEETDVAAGRSAGCGTVLVAPGAPDTAADLVVPDLAAAVDALLGATPR